MSPPPTEKNKWKRSHHQEERLSSRYTETRDSYSLACIPLQQEETKGFILQLGVGGRSNGCPISGFCFLLIREIWAQQGFEEEALRV